MNLAQYLTFEGYDSKPMKVTVVGIRHLKNQVIRECWEAAVRTVASHQSHVEG